MPDPQNPKIEQYTEIFKALSNPNRLKILLRLISTTYPDKGGISSTGDNTCVGELGKDLGIVKSTVSHHIKELKRVGLIRTIRQGQKVECVIDPDILKDLKDFFL